MINKADMMPCKDSRLSWDNQITNYIKQTGDASGTERVDKKNVAVCTDDVWWKSPACRKQGTTCTALISGGTGWGLDVLMQKAAIYDMPFIIGVTKD